MLKAIIGMLKPPAAHLASSELLTFSVDAEGAGGALRRDAGVLMATLDDRPEIVLQGEVDDPAVTAIDVDCAGH